MQIRGSWITAGLALTWAVAAQAAQAQESAAPTPAVPAAAPHQATADAFRAEIDRIYPTGPEDLERRGGAEAVSPTLDAFWQMVKGNRATYLPLLRAELRREGHPAFFYYDGAELLRDASDSRADGELALGLIERADLAMIDRSGLLIALSWYVNHGYDTRRAALRFMENPRDELVVTPFPHVFYYTTLEALIFSLFGMDEQRFVGDLIARVQTARDDHEIFALLHCIWATATPEGRAVLAAYADDRDKPDRARQYAREMLTHELDGPTPTRSEAELRAARRAVIADPFQHGSFERFHALTDELVRIAGRGSAPAADLPDEAGAEQVGADDDHGAAPEAGPGDHRSGEAQPQMRDGE